MDDILKKIRKYVDPHFSINRALDFGCGVGRLLIPLSVYSSHVTGVDVSESMLDEARKNCEARQITNVDFIKSDDDLSLLNRKFNFIHSYIVFQHIPAKRGE
ncbi:MAG TPA: class I SAM-dependent methyltransferase [Balneolales bacterium]|nr:class I SAM-dependent methyltransferase [Balneolales bacterium]